YKRNEGNEPRPYAETQRLVQHGKRQIMGGWYLQPDCNMPTGESLVRQILLGKQYFKEKFGQAPTAASNSHSFGHPR
uniref:glycoside hydrolase family 38 N-terminal domain-containing protein n=1 Tax=Cohnella sp. GbtcB17 TaxID=2824762 RepID=UPI001C2FA702